MEWKEPLLELSVQSIKTKKNKNKNKKMITSFIIFSFIIFAHSIFVSASTHSSLQNISNCDEKYLLENDGNFVTFMQILR